MTKYILTLFFVANIVTTFAQNAFFGTRGRIAFDKITFTKARMRDMMNQMLQNNPGGGGGRMFGGNIDNMPESNTEKYILQFDENSTLLYQDSTNQASAPRGMMGIGMRIQGGNAGGGNRGGQGRGTGSRQAQGGGNRGGQGTRPDQNSKISYQDLRNRKSEVQIQIDDKYILKDTLQNITWRFTNEYRNIAGFECRRVNGSTPDSLYLVAFYTDELPVSAGPALTSGLPGMILGLAIPEMHIQYWATKVDYSNDLVPKDWRDKKSQTLALDEFVKSLGRFFSRGRDNSNAKRQVQEQLIY